MKPLQGFSGFSGFSGMTPDAKMDTEPEASGPKVFDQLMQQLQGIQEGKKTVAKGQANALWPMGTAMGGKKI